MEVIEIVNQMQNYGEDIIDKKVMEKFLVNLLENYDYIVAKIEENGLSTLIIQKLMSHIKHRNYKMEVAHSKVLLARVSQLKRPW